MTGNLGPLAAEAQRLSPQQKARLIYAQAQVEMRSQLWRAALAQEDMNGNGANASGIGGALSAPLNGATLDELVAALGLDNRPSPFPQGTCGTQPGLADSMGGDIAVTPQAATSGADAEGALQLGANQTYAPAISEAARRTGLPPAALAAVVDAEAAKRNDGSWNAYSRNPRSSAAGLGQFLSGTWIGLAERPGSWLNRHAAQQGWLTDHGKVAASARRDLLNLRYDPNASIESIADYGVGNLEHLRRRGVQIPDAATGLARMIYSAHHLGPGDALLFHKGGLPPARARVLLRAQIGGAQAEQRIGQSGDPAAAHRRWLTSYIDSRIRPERYTGA